MFEVFVNVTCIIETTVLIMIKESIEDFLMKFIKMKNSCQRVFNFFLQHLCSQTKIICKLFLSQNVIFKKRENILKILFAKLDVVEYHIKKFFF